jgi:hypothetical protein
MHFPEDLNLRLVRTLKNLTLLAIDLRLFDRYDLQGLVVTLEVL